MYHRESAWRHLIIIVSHLWKWPLDRKKMGINFSLPGRAGEVGRAGLREAGSL